MTQVSVCMEGFFGLHGRFLHDGKVVFCTCQAFSHEYSLFCVNEDPFLYMEGVSGRAEGFFLYLAHGRRFWHDRRRFFST